MLVTKLKHHFFEINTRIVNDGFLIINLNHSAPKKVSINNYESYTTSGVSSDVSKLIIHEQDAERIRLEKKAIRHGYSSKKNNYEHELQVRCNFPSVNFAFFFKNTEVPYIKVTARLAGSNYPNIDHESIISFEELRVKLNQAISSDLRNEELINFLIENIAKTSSSEKDIQELVVARKKEITDEFDNKAEQLFECFNPFPHNKDTNNKLVDEYKNNINNIIKAECHQEDVEIEKLKAKISKLNSQRNKKIKAVMAEAESNEDNKQVVAILELRKQGKAPLHTIAFKLKEFYDNLSDSDKQHVAPTLKNKINEMIDIFNSYNEYELLDYEIMQIYSLAKITN